MCGKMSRVQRQGWESGDLGSVPELCQNCSAGHLKSLCFRSLCAKALEAYLQQHGAKSSCSLVSVNWIPVDAEVQRTRWDELALSSCIRQVPGSQLLVLAVTGALFGNSEGEDVMFSGDNGAFPSLGNAVPSAGGHVLRRELVRPLPPMAIGEADFCVWQQTSIIKNSLLRN